jgi:pyrimidine operon attenuation protein/uracil phosphoribosyltransferase
VITERTHRIRAIQAIINKVANTMTKMVEALGIKTRGASVVYILLSKIRLSGGLQVGTDK